MSAERSSVTVRIAGEDHTIRANAEPEYTRKCAKMVDDRIHEIKMQAGMIEPHKAAILAALSIVDEYFQGQEELDRVRADVARKAASLVDRIDTGLPEAERG